MRALSEDIVEFIASGVDAYVGTRDADLEPESMMAMGVRTHGERGAITVYLPRSTAELTLRNLENNGEVAVTMIQPSTFRAMQIKGRCTGVRPSDETDKEFQRICRSALVEELEIVGVPRHLSRRYVWWPSVAVEVEVRGTYTQTPGPQAGTPWGRSAP